MMEVREGYCLLLTTLWLISSSEAILITMYSDRLCDRNTARVVVLVGGGRGGRWGIIAQEQNRCDTAGFIPRWWNWAPPGWRRCTPAPPPELCFQSPHSPAGPPGWKRLGGWQVWTVLWCRHDACPPVSAAENLFAFDWCLSAAKR